MLRERLQDVVVLDRAEPSERLAHRSPVVRAPEGLFHDVGGGHALVNEDLSKPAEKRNGHAMLTEHVSILAFAPPRRPPISRAHCS